MAEPGRPTKLTPEVRQKFLEALELGGHRAAACKYASVSRTTLADWLRRAARGEEPYAAFKTDLDAAEARAEVLAAGVVYQAVRSGDWKAAVEWLSRRFPERWARVHRLHHELVIPAPAAERMVQAVVRAVERHVQDTEIRARIAQDLEHELFGDGEEAIVAAPFGAGASQPGLGPGNGSGEAP